MSYVEEAEKCIKELYGTPQSTDGRNGRGWRQKDNKITTSQIRNLLSGISDIYNDIVRLDTEELNEAQKDRIRYLKVQFVYAAGRDDKVKVFVEHSGMLEKLDYALKGKKEFIEMEKYMEALVAYHRFYGGRGE